MKADAVPSVKRRQPPRYYRQGREVMDRRNPAVVFAETAWTQDAALITRLLNAHERTKR